MDLLSRCPNNLDKIFEYACFTNYFSRNTDSSFFSESNLQSDFMKIMYKESKSRENSESL